MAYRCVTKLEELRTYLSGSSSHELATLIAFDFETAPDDQWRNDDRAALDPHKSHIVGVSFSVSAGSAVYVPMAHVTGTNVDMYDFLAEFAADESITKVAHNLSFESMFLYALGIVIQPPVYDTIAAAQLTLKNNASFRTLGDSGLKTLVPTLYKTELPTFESVTNGRSFAELYPHDDETIRYACADADHTLRLFHTFNRWFDTYLPKHRYIVEQIESPTAVYVGIMKYNVATRIVV